MCMPRGGLPDTPIIEGKYQFAALPVLAGAKRQAWSAKSGKKVSHLKVGDRVMALTGWGSFAEQVAVPGYNVLIPPSMDFNTAAALQHDLRHFDARPQAARPLRGRRDPAGAGRIRWRRAGRGNRQGHGARDRRHQQRRQTGRGQGGGADELINYSETNLKDEIKRLTDGNGFQT